MDAQTPPPDASSIEPAPSWADLPPVVAPDRELLPFSTREARYAELCATARGDAFFQRLCRGFRPNIPDFAGLLKLLGLDQNRAFALTGNSTSLVTKSVSAVNPRIILFPRVSEELAPPAELIAVGFVRGEQFVEILSRDGATGELAFYLLSFERACSYEPAGCDLASLLSEEIEHDWTAYSVYTEHDLENTSFDCLNCHRPEGVGTRAILRMQELTSPWMHWFPQRFAQRTESDRVLTAQFLETHRVDAQYGGIPIGTIENALDEGSGAQLEALVRAEGFGDQPNAFDPRIATEAANGGTSPTWLALFDVARRGEAIAVPYPQIDVTDEALRTAASRSYVDVVTNVAPRESLLDLRDVFSEDAVQKLGFVPQPDADGRAILVQMCSRCHDGRGDPSISRSDFNVRALEQMTREEKDYAIERMSDPPDTRMPPRRAGG
jgi:hypothetical protein